MTERRPHTGGQASPPLSLGVYRGTNPRAVDEYERWLGRPVEYVLEFWGRDQDWSKIDDPSWLLDQWAGIDRTVVFSIALLPNERYSLRDGAAGRYDVHWERFARALVAAGRGDSILRLGWEFNGAFYPWAAGGREDDFVSYWQRVVTTLRSVPGTSFRFDWTPLAGNANADVERAYPGDAYVDIIGLDAYDNSPVAGPPEARWADIRDRRYGLAWHRDFAAARGKPVSFPEWGLTDRPGDELGGGDNPHYIGQMHGWFRANPPLYAMYFEYDARDADHRLMLGERPESATTFLELFGG